mgnify:CR=1 FL=1
MKRIIIIAALLLSTLAASAQDGRSIYRKYSGAEGVTAVYISPAMFRLIGKIPDINVDGGSVNLAPLIQSLSGLYLIESENRKVNAELRADADALVGSGKYEPLMEVRESSQTVQMFTVGTEEVITGFVMISDEEDETVFICLDGRMKRADLETLLAEQISAD